VAESIENQSVDVSPSPAISPPSLSSANFSWSDISSSTTSTASSSDSEETQSDETNITFPSIEDSAYRADEPYIDDLVFFSIAANVSDVNLKLLLWILRNYLPGIPSG